MEASRILAALSPPANEPLADTAVNVASVAVTLAADTVFVDFQLSGGAARVVPADSTPDTGKGAIYQPNITYRMTARNYSKLYVERASAWSGTISVTCFTSPAT